MKIDLGFRAPRSIVPQWTDNILKDAGSQWMEMA